MNCQVLCESNEYFTTTSQVFVQVVQVFLQVMQIFLQELCKCLCKPLPDRSSDPKPRIAVRSPCRQPWFCPGRRHQDFPLVFSTLLDLGSLDPKIGFWILTRTATSRLSFGSFGSWVFRSQKLDFGFWPGRRHQDFPLVLLDLGSLDLPGNGWRRQTFWSSLWIQLCCGKRQLWWEYVMIFL